MATLKVEGTKEWVRTVDIVDPEVEKYEAGELRKAENTGERGFFRE